MRPSARLVLILLSLALLTSVGCGNTTMLTDQSAGAYGLPQGPAEKAYCPYLPSKTSFGSANLATISGSAGYTYRQNGEGQYGTLSTSTRPIRFAEVRVTDGGGNVVQCAETDANGNFSFAMPADGATYHVAVASRALNSQIKVSVLNHPENNTPYEVSMAFTTNANKTLTPIVAQADQAFDASISGGAFNILDDIYQANVWLRTQTANCGASLINCQAFSVAPKITAYWAAGFNPGVYFGGDRAISFYLPGQSTLLILGGMNGDVDNSDNDQFDNSVIIHEYGHFIEDIYAKTNSPGGSHNGDSILDPRLAWGEGWADFFQAAVTGNAVYRDTYGTASGSFGVYFNADITSQTDGMDIPASPDEGIFHEFAITRTLWGAIAPHPISNIASQENGINGGLRVPFRELWYLFTNTNVGFKSKAFHFRNMGLWLRNQSTLNLEDLSPARSAELISSSQDHYAIPVTSTGCAMTNTITGYREPYDNGSFATSNLARSNHFYHIHHNGGSAGFTMRWTPSHEATDLDLYLYNETYVFGDTTTMSGISNNSITCTGGSTCTRSLYVGSLPPGDYLLDVMVFTQYSAGSTSTYNITYNGGQICPDPQG
jgi:hypothetical protein